MWLYCIVVTDGKLYRKKYQYLKVHFYNLLLLFQFRASLATIGSATWASAHRVPWASTSRSGDRPAAGRARSTPPQTGPGQRSPLIASDRRVHSTPRAGWASWSRPTSLASTRPGLSAIGGSGRAGPSEYWSSSHRLILIKNVETSSPSGNLASLTISSIQLTQFLW